MFRDRGVYSCTQWGERPAADVRLIRRARRRSPTRPISSAAAGRESAPPRNSCTAAIADAGELRVKESDRLATTCAMLRAFGVEVEELADGLVIHGQPGGRLRAAHIDSHGDHRIAMSATIAALVADGPSRIEDTDNVATSYPGFARALNQLAGGQVVSEVG